MNGADIGAILTALTALVSAVTALIKQWHHNKIDEEHHAAIASDVVKIANQSPYVDSDKLEAPRVLGDLGSAEYQ